MMCVYESIDVLKLALVTELLLRPSGNGSVNFALWCILGLCYTKDINFIFFPSNFQFFYFHIDE